MALLAVVSCFASGYFLIAWVFSRSVASVYDWMLRASLAVGFGLGLFSIIFFLTHVAGVRHLVAIDLLVVALTGGIFLLLRGKSVGNGDEVTRESDELPKWLDRVLTGSFAIAVFASVDSAVLRSIAHPHGEGWDAFAIWNLHARFLFAGGEHWHEGFSPLIPWSHPDYPLLLPTAIAHFWSVLGHESSAVPSAIGLVFTFGTLGLLVSSLGVLRGRVAAKLGGLALAATPFFVEQGSSQYADVPLSFFFLAAMVLLHYMGQLGGQESAGQYRGTVVLAGLAAGFAAWTKNEGMLFLLAMVAAEILGRRPDRSRLAMLLAGVSPCVAVVLWFKRVVAFPNELFSGGASMMHQALDAGRYWAITRWYVREFFRFGEWWIVPGTLLLMALYVLAMERRVQNCDGVRTSIVVLMLTFLGYFAIYVITPYELFWHLRFSLNRLFLQLWPCAIFVFLVAAPLKVGLKSQNEPKFLKNGDVL